METKLKNMSLAELKQEWKEKQKETYYINVQLLAASN